MDVPSERLRRGTALLDVRGVGHADLRGVLGPIGARRSRTAASGQLGVHDPAAASTATRRDPEQVYFAVAADAEAAGPGSCLVCVPGEALASKSLLAGGQVLAAVVAEACGQQRQNEKQTED